MMIAPLDLPVRRLFRSLSSSAPWRGGSDGSGTDTASRATGAGAKSDSPHDNFAAAAAPLSYELQTWPISPPSSASSSSTTTRTATPAFPRAITTLAEDPESLSSSQDQQSQLTRLRLHSARQREKYPHQLPQIRPRASRGSFDSSRSRSSTLSTTSSSGDDLTAFRHPQERQRACEDCWKEFWG
ncbi:hypothetical protein PG985_010589 [Apiospora marii]|uniref:Uncharacterized protein n=1 Tax=Apiospora marii TaxID=335849 RepID=A0ABR1T1Q9_9PEZI